MAINRTQKDKKLFKVLFVAAEVAPYATVGGFASVISYLSKELVQRGHDVRVLFPKFGLIDEEKYKTKMVHEGLKVPTGDEDTPELVCNVKKFKEVSGGVEIYLLENQEYYEKRANVYDYSDDHIRWALLSRGALEFIRAKIFVPDIIHSHDWHTGIVSNYMKTTYQDDPILSEVTSVFTIHNLKFQGMFDPKHVSELEFDDGKSPVASFFDPRLRDQNYMRRGILYSDVVNTVSKTYAKEIMTEEFGEGLDKLLCEVRYKVFGIVNGLDYSEFDPKTDTLIHRNFDLSSVDELRVENKIALQKEFDLPEREDTMLIGFVGRLDHQKGVDLMISTLYHVLRDFDVQFVHVGGGDGGLADMLYKLREDFLGKVNIYPHPNFVLPRLMFAGCDLMLFPSRCLMTGITY